MRPAMSQIHFSFEDFDMEDLQCWYQHMNQRAVRSIRKISMDVYRACFLGPGIRWHDGHLVDNTYKHTRDRCDRDCGRLRNVAQLSPGRSLCRRRIEVDLDSMKSPCKDNFEKCWRAETCCGTIDSGNIRLADHGIPQFLKLVRSRVSRLMLASSSKAALNRAKIRGLLEVLLEIHGSGRVSVRCVKCDGLELVAQAGRGKAEPFLCGEGRCDGAGSHDCTGCPRHNPATSASMQHHT